MNDRKNSRKRKRTVGLLLTPLIDIMFLLTLFFVLNTSFRNESYLEVGLPESSTAEKEQADGIIITLRNDESIDVDGNDVPWHALTSAIEKIREKQSINEVIIRGDKSIAYERVVGALDRVRMAGINSISLQTIRESR